MTTKTKSAESETRGGEESRRRFLGKSAALLAAGCFGSLAGFRQALALAESLGKPLLTLENLNAYIDEHFNAPLRTQRGLGGLRDDRRTVRDPRRQLADEARADLLAFLQKRFTVTDAQAAYIQQNFSDADLSWLHQALQTSLDQGTALNFADSGGGEVGAPGPVRPPGADPKADDTPTHLPGGGPTGTMGFEVTHNASTNTTTVKVWWPWG